ncbi:hypothetical protein IC617_15265 [Neiella sp. HB171785]|uniref:Peptidase M3A/M3B catalytic domain-containing protein n=1 Tax=Neiella litorisoli TaxID=2771431 RepID=A0A8J6R3U9_9GAMM|nr:M3 family metallopeptidase [Neiella litorisoli]MBD1390790.1 hypothetical protein [Neiella litorisoli]
MRQCNDVGTLFNSEFAAQPDEQTLMALDHKLAQVEQTIAKAMVVADASQSEPLKSAALQCIEQLSVLQSEWTNLATVSTTLAKLSEQPLSKQGSRLISLWLLQRDLVSSPRAQKAAELLSYAELSYQQTLQRLDKKLRLPERCTTGVPAELLAQWRLADQFELPLRGVPVARYLASGSPDECRRMAWVALASKGMPDNMVQLDMMLGQRHALARLQGAAHWADLQLRTQLLNEVELVNRYLQRSFQPRAKTAADQQRASDWLWRASTTQSMALAPVDESIAARQVLASVFAALGDFGLRFELAADIRDSWHPAVESYHVYSGDNLLGTLMLDLFARPAKSAKPRHRPLQHGISDRQPAISAVITSLPSQEWHGRERRVLYQQLGAALQHLFARADYYGLSGGSVEGDFSRLGMTLLPILMQAHDPWLAAQQTSDRKLAKQYFRAATALAYHQLENANFASLQQVNQYYFSRYFGLPMPDEFTPQYALSTLVSDGALYYQRLWYPQFAAWLMTCDGVSRAALLSHLFGPAGQQSALTTIKRVCPATGSLAELVTQVASVQRFQ